MTNKELRECCSLYDCKELKELIVDNSDLPLLLFVGEEAYSGECCSCSIKGLTFYKDMWMDKDDYEGSLSKDLKSEEKFFNLTNKEFSDMIDKKVKETEFIDAICLYVG